MARDPTEPLQKLGPGLITGAADNDPTGIATYSQVGAQFGYCMLWVTPFSYPLMVAIQMISARIGRISGHGIAENIRRYYPPWLLRCLIGLFIIANIINLAADIGAMGEALQLLVGGPEHFHAVVFGLVSALLEIFLPYPRYVPYLKWLTLTPLAYVGALFAVEVPWGQVLYHTLIPRLSVNLDYLTGLMAVLGTTISPYLFFWQASQEVEDQHAARGAEPLKQPPRQTSLHLRRIKTDTLIGMGFFSLITFFIMVTVAATLHTQGLTDIQTSAQAAEALCPIAGRFAFVLFSSGIIGGGMLAVPVLAGSTAYAVGEAMHWRVGLTHKPREAKGFYGIIAGATLVGTLLDFTPIDPIKALFWSAVINGLVAVPLMAVMILIASDPRIMGHLVMTSLLKLVGWLATLVMALVAIGFVLGV